MERVETGVSRAHPEHSEGLTEGQQFVLALHLRCLNLFRAIRVLLSEGLAVEAHQLLRTLIEDGVLIRYLHERSSDLEGLVLRHLHREIRQEIGLLEGFISRGITAEKYRALVNDRNDELEEVRQRLQEMGVQSSPLPTADERLRAIRHGETQYVVDMADKFVHTSRLALGQYIQEQDDRYVLRREAPTELVLWAGWIATAIYGIGSISAAQILDWERVSELIHLSEEVTDDLTALMQEAEVGGEPHGGVRGGRVGTGPESAGEE